MPRHCPSTGASRPADSGMRETRSGFRTSPLADPGSETYGECRTASPNPVGVLEVKGVIVGSSADSGKQGELGWGAAVAGTAAMLMGLLVVVLGAVSILMWSDARNSRHTTSDSTSNTAGTPAMTGMDMSASANAGSLTSYAGAAPENADALATAHHPYPAALPPAYPGPVADVHLKLTDINVQIAPGVHYAAWAWAGGAPGPVIHVRQGQMVKITLTNNGAISHSVDFHAARIAPNKAFKEVLPSKSVSYSFRATDPGVFMYHCGTKPVLMHIANGMYGAIV